MRIPPELRIPLIVMSLLVGLIAGQAVIFVAILTPH